MFYRNPHATLTYFLQLTLEIFVSFTSEAIKGGVEALTGDVQVINENVKELRQAVVLNTGKEDLLPIIRYCSTPPSQSQRTISRHGISPPLEHNMKYV